VYSVYTVTKEYPFLLLDPAENCRILQVAYENEQMVYRFLMRFLFTRPNTDKIFLGRWGYHWEINKHVQKYYD
jgi:hypothetical protein